MTLLKRRLWMKIKKIHLSNRIVSILFKIKKLFLLGYVLLGIIYLIYLFLSLPTGGCTYIGLWWMVGFLIIYFIFRFIGKPTVYLTTAMINVYHLVNTDYWLKVTWVKKTSKNETIYDVVYFDNDKQVMMETLSETLFIRKIGENSTHYKTRKESVSVFLESDKFKTIAMLFKSSFLEIEGEVEIDLSDLEGPLGHSFLSMRMELEQRYEVCQYDKKCMKENNIAFIKEHYLEALVHELNQTNANCHFEILKLSPDTHKTDVLGESSFRE